MIKFEDALAQVLATAVPSSAESEPVALSDALGRYLAADVVAASPVPGFDNSAMDGYAVRAAEVQAGAPLPVSQRVPAGSDPQALQAGTVARIFTGAKVPDGADAVMLQEDATVGGDGAVSFSEMPRPGQHIRLAGESVASDSVVAQSGQRLGAAEIALLAATGVAAPQCHKPLRVAYFSTGDELREPGEALAGAQIYNSNRPMLGACLSQLGLQPVDLGVCGDTAGATRETLLAAAAQADCILATGGMSVGEEDHVRREADALGDLEFWKIAMKPGKPFAAGKVQGVPFFGLPGNPVSTFVTFQLLVKPWLLKTLGANHQPVKLQAKAQFDWHNRGKRLDFLRARVTGDDHGVLQVEVYPEQGSGVLASIGWANALLPLAAGRQLGRGDLVEVLLL